MIKWNNGNPDSVFTQIFVLAIKYDVSHYDLSHLMSPNIIMVDKGAVINGLVK